MIRVVLAFSLLCVCFCVFCSSEKEQDAQRYEPGPTDPQTGIATAEFQWQNVGGPPLTFFYEPYDSLEMIAARLQNKISEVYRLNAHFLGVSDPPPVEFYCYRDMESFQSHTNRDVPFYISDKMYYGYGPPFGRMVAVYILHEVREDSTRFHFMAEGLPTLYDWSGRNYHDAAHQIMTQDRLPSLNKIIDNTSYDTLSMTVRNIAAASFLGFLMHEYGTQRVMEIYATDEAFPEAVENVLGLSVGELEENWRDFLPEHTKEKELERGVQQ
jgi:hypothetical protein